MKKKDSKLVAWRLSKQARDTLKLVAKQTGLTQTKIVELCVAKHALEIPGLADAVKKSLVELVAGELGQKKNEK